MRTGAAADHTGYFHETAFYGTDDELLAIAVPFVEDGRAAGETTLVALNRRNGDLLRTALGDADGIRFLPAGAPYDRPANTIAAYRSLLAAEVAGGAQQIRVLGEVPHPGTGADWTTWLRYEAVINHALDDFPLWGLCPYDTRITPDEVLADVERLHPHVTTPSGERYRNERFVDPASYTRSRLAESALEAARLPALTLRDVVSPRPVRQAVRALATESLLDRERIDDLVTSVSEVVTNALLHGRRPIDVHVIADTGVLTCEVHDRGAGPGDPFVGLLAPAPGSLGGYGLWVAHQVCDRVDLVPRADGFTVRLVVTSA